MQEQNFDHNLDNNPPGNNSEYTPSGRELFVDALDQMGAEATYAQNNPFSKAKIGSFNSGPLDSYQSLDRYYENPGFNDLGFNPYIDMESYYDKNTNAWDTFKRSQKQWNKLFGLAWESMTGGVSAGTEADKYGEASRIGSTGNMLNDTYINSGYTIGLMSEIAVEEVALGALTYLTEGAAGEVAVARTAQNVGRLGKAFKTVGQFGKTTTRTLDRLKDLRDVGKARNVWEGVKNTGKAFNPLKGTTEFVQAARAGELKNIKDLAAANKAFGSFYRDIREINLASNEADLEAGFVQNTVNDELYKEFVAINGRQPNEKELERIRELANDAANSTYIANMGLIYTTNRLAFDGFFRKFSPKFGKSTLHTGLGKIVHNRKFYKTGAPAYEVVQEGLKGFKQTAKKRFSKAGLKATPLDTIKFLGKYTKVNFAEGFQEYGQEVIQHMDVQRAKDEYYGALRGGYYDYLTSSMDKFIGSEGLHVFMSGFLMGGMVGPYVKAQEFALEKGGKLGKRIFQPGKYKDEQNYKAKREQHLQEQVDKMNEMANDPIKYFNMQSLGGLVDQVEGKNETEKYNRQNKEKEFRDIEDMAAGKAILSALQSGYYDSLIDQLEGMTSLSEKELQEAFSSADQEGLHEFKKNSEDIITRAKSIKNFYEEVNKRFENPYDRNAEGLDTELGISEKQRWQAYENAKAFVVLNQYSFMRSLERMDSISNDITSNLPFWKKSKIAANDVNILLEPQELSKEMELLRSEISSLKASETLTKSDRKDLKNKEKKLTALTSFNEKLGEYLTATSSKEILKQLTEASETVMGATVKLNTKAGGTATVVGETTTRGGKPAYRLDNGKVVLKKNVEVIEGITESFQKDEVNPALEALQKEYKKYLEELARASEDHVDNEGMESSFQSMLDFYSLNNDSKNLSKIVSQLLDPQGFDLVAMRETQVLEKLWQDKEEDIKNDLKAFYERAELNELLSEIAKTHKAFILEEDVEELLNNDIIPEEFYDINSLRPIAADSKRHFDIVKEIQNFFDKTGKKETDTKDKWADASKKKRQYKTKSRTSKTKTPNHKGMQGNLLLRRHDDSRIYDDFTSYYGIKDNEATDLKQHVQKVISNEYTHPYLKDIFERLLPFIEDNIDIEWDSSIFDKGAIGLYYPDSNSIAMDPYAHEYGSYYEAVLLHELVHYFTSNELYSNGKFSNVINSLYKETLSELEKAGIDTNYYGFTNAHEFLAEAYSNPEFQKQLMTLKDSRGSNMWQKFLEAIKNVLNELFNLDITNTRLAQVLTLTDDFITGKTYNQALNALIEQSNKEGEALTEEYLRKLYTEEEIINIAINDNLINLNQIIEENNKKPLNINQPLEEWPQSIIDEVEKLRIQFNKNIDEREDLSDVAKQNSKIDSIDRFIKSPVRKAQIIKMIDKYNSTLSTAEPVTETVVEETIVEEPTQDTEQVTGQVDEEVVEGQGVEIEIEDQGEVETEELPSQEDFYAETDVTLSLSKEQQDNLATKKSRYIVLPLKKTSVQPVINELIKNNLLQPGEELTTEKAGLQVNIKIKDADGIPYLVRLIYSGKLTAGQAQGAYNIIQYLNLPTEPTDTYSHPFEIEGTTYYAENKSQADWIQNSGKQHVFDVAHVQELEMETQDKETKEFQKWGRASQKKLNTAENSEELEMIHHQVVEQNLEREMAGKTALTEKQLDLMYNIAEQKLSENMKPSDFKVGEKFNMKGKMTKFGVGVVSQSTNQGVKFVSVKTGEESNLIPQNQLSKVVSNKITDMSEAVSEKLVDEVTNDEKEIIKDNQESTKEFAKDKDSLAKLQESLKKKSAEDVDNDFMNNLGC